MKSLYKMTFEKHAANTPTARGGIPAFGLLPIFVPIFVACVSRYVCICVGVCVRGVCLVPIFVRIFVACDPRAAGTGVRKH